MIFVKLCSICNNHIKVIKNCRNKIVRKSLDFVLKIDIVQKVFQCKNKSTRPAKYRENSLRKTFEK